jgi:hypothetical protein
LLLASSINAQQLSRTEIEEKLEKEGCVTLTASKVKICKYDYLAGSKTVEAITIRPLADSKYPAIMMIPGFGGTAKTFITLGTIFAQQGFACLSVTEPGYGKSKANLVLWDLMILRLSPSDSRNSNASHLLIRKRWAFSVIHAAVWRPLC